MINVSKYTNRMKVKYYSWFKEYTHAPQSSVFISYSSKDKLSYERISSYLKILKQDLSYFEPEGVSERDVLFRAVLNYIRSEKGPINKFESSRIKLPERALHLNPNDPWIEVASWSDCIPVKLYKCDLKEKKDILKEQLKFIRKLLIEFRKKKVLGYIIDLRQIFRTKIRFLFKNMDDCSSHNNVLAVNCCNPLLKTIKKHEKNRNNKIFARPA